MDFSTLIYLVKMVADGGDCYSKQFYNEDPMAFFI